VPVSLAKQFTAAVFVFVCHGFYIVVSRKVLVCSQPPVSLVARFLLRSGGKVRAICLKQLGIFADHSSSSNTDIKNAWSYISA